MIPGVSGSSLQFSESGLYCVEATFPGGCVVKSECQTVTSSASMKVAADGFTLFPNPASSLLNIHLGADGDFTGEISIRNMLGQGVATLSSAGMSSISVEGWPSGVYFVSASLRNGGSIQKMVRIGTR